MCRYCKYTNTWALNSGLFGESLHLDENGKEEKKWMAFSSIYAQSRYQKQNRENVEIRDRFVFLYEK